MAETLKRLGTSRESAARLGRRAAEAERVLGIHGVSVTAGHLAGPASTADREAVERVFPVHARPPAPIRGTGPWSGRGR